MKTSAGQHLDALLALVRFAARVGYEPGPDIADLARHLHAESLVTERVSGVGNRPTPCGTIESVNSFVTPDEAGRASGLTGRRVRQLCSTGLVAHRIVGGGRYLVDLDDLHRHLRGGAA